MSRSLQQVRGSYESVRSRFSESLIRIHQSIEESRRNEARVEDLFQAWQKKWVRKRTQIKSRLELIEQQLDALSTGESPQPKLSVVGQSVAGSNGPTLRVHG